MVDKKEGKAEEGNAQDRTVKLLEELVKWTKFSSMPGVRKTLLDILKDDERKLVYQLSDGKGSVEIAKMSGVGASTIPEWWKTWNKAGITEAIPVKGGERAKRIFSLEDFGIDVPKMKKVNNTEKPTIAQSEPTSNETVEEKKNE